MDKAQAIQTFWSGFGLTAYDESNVPDDAQMPYITYGVGIDSIDAPVYLSASLWYRSTSWAEISQKAEEIEAAIRDADPITMKIDGGRLYLTRGNPFAQRMSDEDDMVRRIYLNVTAEFLTA